MPPPAAQLTIRPMRPDEAPAVLQLLQDAFQDVETRLILHVLTRPPALLLLAVASSALRLLLGSLPAALLLPLALGGAALKAAAWRGPHRRPLPAAGLWVAVAPGEAAPRACAALEPRDEAGRAAELSRLAVGRRHRRAGLARRLLAFLEGRARAQGYERLLLRVPAGAPAARALLEGAGYRRQGPRAWLGCALLHEFGKEL
ncbi:probable N-acetyltransferase 14 [Dromaius novaehollandiae]|uniref:probable N-acetyltransferase 14 n=1 Tax=Dromaius novaehollandiae TaxID=8790 RepID=UPI00311F01B9